MRTEVEQAVMTNDQLAKAMLEDEAKTSVPDAVAAFLSQDRPASR
jgi:hypothetical protein